MVALTAITKGMENGPEAIDKNDQALNAGITANTAAIPKKAQIDLSISNKPGAGSPATSISGTLWRDGTSVFINATYSTNGSGAGGTVAVIQVPSGFRSAGANKNYFLRNDAGEFCYIDGSGVVNSIATNNTCSITGSWPTEDDYPA